MLSIGAMSEKTGVNIETVRYYERIGLLRKPARTDGGHRLYEKADLGRLTFIRRCRDLGFSVDSIRELLHMVDGSDLTCADVRSIAETHLATIRLRLADLRRMEQTLATMVRQCSGTTVPDCPIIEALSA